MGIGNTFFESDGKSVNVDLLYTVPGDSIAYIDGFLGIAVGDGESGDVLALNIDRREYQFEIPDTISPVQGDTIYIEVADLTGHTPDSTAYSTSSGVGKKALCRCTSDYFTGANGVRTVTGILLPDGV